MQSLRERGHTVEHIGEIKPGISDQEVLSIARNQRAILITADKDFGQLLFLHGQAAVGVLFLRLSGVPAHEKERIVLDVIETYGSQLAGAFSVVTPFSVRIRQILPN